MRSACLFLLTCVAAVLPAVAQTHSLRLPDMPLADAINLLAEQTDTVIIAEASDLAGLSAKPLSGQMEVDEALAALLSGTSLSVSRDGNGVWTSQRLCRTISRMCWQTIFPVFSSSAGRSAMAPCSCGPIACGTCLRTTR